MIALEFPEQYPLILVVIDLGCLVVRKYSVLLFLIKY